MAATAYLLIGLLIGYWLGKNDTQDGDAPERSD